MNKIIIILVLMMVLVSGGVCGVVGNDGDSASKDKHWIVTMKNTKTYSPTSSTGTLIQNKKITLKTDKSYLLTDAEDIALGKINKNDAYYKSIDKKTYEQLTPYIKKYGDKIRMDNTKIIYKIDDTNYLTYDSELNQFSNLIGETRGTEFKYLDKDGKVQTATYFSGAGTVPAVAAVTAGTKTEEKKNSIVYGGRQYFVSDKILEALKPEGATYDPKSGSVTLNKENEKTTTFLDGRKTTSKKIGDRWVDDSKTENIGGQQVTTTYDVDNDGKQTFKSATIGTGTNKITIPNEEVLKQITSLYSSNDKLTVSNSIITIKTNEGTNKAVVSGTGTSTSPFSIKSNYDTETNNYALERTITLGTLDNKADQITLDRVQTFERVYTVTENAKTKVVTKEEYDKAAQETKSADRVHTSDREIEYTDVEGKIPDWWIFSEKAKSAAAYKKQYITTRLYQPMDKDGTPIKDYQKSYESLKKDAFTGDPVEYKIVNDDKIESAARYYSNNKYEIFDGNQWKTPDEDKEEQNKALSALKSERTASSFRAWDAATQYVLTEFQGLGFYSSLFMTKEELAAWREGVDQFFCSTIVLGDVECWTSLVCQMQFDKTTAGVAYVDTPDGLKDVAASIQGERSTPIATDNGTEYFYKFTYYAKATTADIEFNIVLDDRVPLFDKNMVLKGKDDGDGEEHAATGEYAIVQYSKKLYNEVCLVFVQGNIPTICNSIPLSDYSVDNFLKTDKKEGKLPGEKAEDSSAAPNVNQI